MILGIPTIVRYDLLQVLLDSAEAGTLRPSLYVIVDNGGELRQQVRRLPANTEVIGPDRNLGVAASWNLLLDRGGDEPVVISNDDLTLPPSTFEQLATAVQTSPLVTAGGWHLFAQAPECTRTVGYYDEAYWPAYYEDTDYEYRRRLLGAPRLDLPLDVPHEGSGSLKVDWRLRRHRSGEYYNAKWGGPPGGEQHQVAFNGNPPPGWTERTIPWDPAAAPRKDPLVRWMYRAR